MTIPLFQQAVKLTLQICLKRTLALITMARSNEMPGLIILALTGFSHDYKM